MAIKAAVRFKPEVGRTPLETTIQTPDFTATPPTGGMVRIIQLVGWDDATLPLASYQAGMPDSERRLVVIDQKAVTLDISAFSGITYAAAEALWQAELTAAAAEWTPVLATLLRAAAGSVLADPVVLQ